MMAAHSENYVLTEATVVLRSQAERDLFNGFASALEHLRRFGYLPGEQNDEPSKPARIAEPGHEDAMSLVREYTRSNGGARAVSEIDTLTLRNNGAEPSPRTVYDHFYGLLYGGEG